MIPTGTGTIKKDRDTIIHDFCELVNSVDKSKDAKELLKLVASEIESGTDQNEMFLFKMFVLNRATGKMINKDNADNVSFRVDTINMIFNTIAKYFDLDDTTKASDEVFFEVGKKCGCDFGVKFLEELDDRGDYEIEDAIKEWCDFDSTVGWGKFTYDDENKSIVVSNAFQVRKGKGNCTFIKGYVTGVLSTVFPKVRIIEEESCENCPKKCRSKDCTFRLDLGE